MRFAETDAMGIVHHSRYLPIMEEARVAYLRDIGHPYQSVRDEGLDFTVLEVFVQYRQPIRFDEVVDVHLSLSQVERASFQMAYLLTVDDQVRATGVTAHGCITADGRPSPLASRRGCGSCGHDDRRDRVDRNDRIRIDVAPDDGGRVAQITVDEIALLVGLRRCARAVAAGVGLVSDGAVGRTHSPRPIPVRR